MAKITISLCALLGFLLVLAYVGETKLIKPCCTKFHTAPLPRQRLCGYSVDQTCRLNAVRFLTLKNITVCANPKQAWVQEAMEFIKNQMVAGETAAICRKNKI